MCAMKLLPSEAKPKVIQWFIQTNVSRFFFLLLKFEFMKCLHENSKFSSQTNNTFSPHQE